jgi:hypothetical protein
VYIFLLWVTKMSNNNGWDIRSGVIGMFLGVMFTILITAILFWTRSLVFSVCPNQQPVCRSQNYLADPAQALANGSKVEDILFLESGNLLYKRVPNTNTCTPSPSNQAVIIPYPQWCEFGVSGGNKYEARNLRFGSPTYTYKDGDGNDVHVLVEGDSHCTPIRSTGSVVIDGAPLLKWDQSSSIV